MVLCRLIACFGNQAFALPAAAPIVLLRIQYLLIRLLQICKETSRQPDQLMVVCYRDHSFMKKSHWHSDKMNGKKDIHKREGPMAQIISGSAELKKNFWI